MNEQDVINIYADLIEMANAREEAQRRYDDGYKKGLDVFRRRLLRILKAEEQEQSDENTENNSR